MKLIGGEIELKPELYSIYYTDSGRSSLRLILKNLKGKTVALPDFLCSIIVDVFNDENIKYFFYKVCPDLRIDISLISSAFDVLYIIDYFGVKHDYLGGQELLKSKIIIEDNVFSPFIENTANFKNWISFNSYRKFSYCAEGSLIKSSFNMDSKDINPSFANYIYSKYKAKEKKSFYLEDNTDITEMDYLNLFEEGDRLIDKQKEIYSVSPKGYYFIQKYQNEINSDISIRDNNFLILKKWLSPITELPYSFKSFFVFYTKERDNLRRDLYNNNIFLPVHWPNILNIDNDLYKNLLSIPIDSRYSEEEMQRILLIVSKYC